MEKSGKFVSPQMWEPCGKTIYKYSSIDRRYFCDEFELFSTRDSALVFSLRTIQPQNLVASKFEIHLNHKWLSNPYV